MATHSSILVWRIPWTEEPGRLQFMGLQIIGHTERLSTDKHPSDMSYSIVGFEFYVNESTN